MKNATPQRIAYAMKQFGGFLGKSFLNVLTAPKIKGGPLELDLSKLKDEIIKDYHAVAHPEKAFLNDFEQTLKDWLKNTLGKNERMVIFIDDLDRCLPEVSLEVLEALKLYLNIEKLIFIVGLDKEVVQRLIEVHYRETLKFPENEEKEKKEGENGEAQENSKALRGKNYFAKIFQYEIEIHHTDLQIEKFLETHLANLEFDGKKLKKEERGIFEKEMLRIAGRNPREVKRLFNSAMLWGAGAIMGAKPVEKPQKSSEDENLSFAQGIQRFFVYRILGIYINPNNHIARSSDIFDLDCCKFFHEWSVLVEQNKQEKDVLFYIPKEEWKRYQQAMLKTGSPEEITQIELFGIDALHGRKCDYLLKLLENEKYEVYHVFLHDSNLGELMQIEFPSRVAGTEQADISTERGEGIILEAIAEKLKITPQEVIPSHFQRIIALNLSNRNIEEISMLAKLTNLEYLDIRDTAVSDVSPLTGLTNMESLYINNTAVSDVSPLAKLTNLGDLDISGTAVDDVSPLAKLTNLGDLDISGTAVDDVSPLAGLTNLKRLYMSGTVVDDVSPLAGLTNLEYLYIRNTAVDDISPLEKLTKLKYLNIRNTAISYTNRKTLKEALPNCEILTISE